jgi:hypothetical protein
MIGYEWKVGGKIKLNYKVYHIERLANFQKGLWKLEIYFLITDVTHLSSNLSELGFSGFSGFSG